MVVGQNQQLGQLFWGRRFEKPFFERLGVEWGIVDVWGRGAGFADLLFNDSMI